MSDTWLSTVLAPLDFSAPLQEFCETYGCSARAAIRLYKHQVFLDLCRDCADVAAANGWKGRRDG